MKTRQERNGPERDQAGAASERECALNNLFSLAYEELRRLASSARRNEANGTLSSTALVHEAWLKLRHPPHLAETPLPHFKVIAAKAMRQVLVDEARRRNARKRGGAGEALRVSIGDLTGEVASCSTELLALDAALEELSQVNLRQAQMVESRFFGGLNVAEIAELFAVSESVVERDSRAAKAWLSSRIRPGTK